MIECKRGHQNEGFEKLQEESKSEDSSGDSSASLESAVFATSSSFGDAESSHCDKSSRLVEHMKHQFGEIRNVWSKNVDGLKRVLNALKVSGHTDSHRLGKDREIFDIVLCIFYGPLVAASETTHLLEEAHLFYPDEAEFLIPQLAASLLYGPHESVDLLHRTLLRICSKSNTFAHRLYYFITSFALSGAGVDPHGVWIIERLLADIAKEGESPCKYLAMDESTVNEQYSIPVTTSANTNTYANAADPSITKQHFRYVKKDDQSFASKPSSDVINSMCSSTAVAADGPAPHLNFPEVSKIEIDENKATCKAPYTESFPKTSLYLVSSIAPPVAIPTTSLQQKRDDIFLIDKPSISNNKIENSENKQVCQHTSEKEQLVDPLISVANSDETGGDSGYSQCKELSFDKGCSAELFKRNENVATLDRHNHMIRRYPIPLLHLKTVNKLIKYKKYDIGGGDSSKFEEEIQNIDWCERKEDKRESLDKRGNKRGKDQELEIIKRLDSKLSRQYVPMDNHFASSIRFWEKMMDISRVLGSIPR